jgi:hypothetical protein
LKFPFYGEGYDFRAVVRRVRGLFELDADAILITGKHPQRAQASSLACYWAVPELGVTVVVFARLLGINQPAVTKAAGRGACRRSEVEIDFI